MPVTVMFMADGSGFSVLRDLQPSQPASGVQLLLIAPGISGTFHVSQHNLCACTPGGTVTCLLKHPASLQHSRKLLGAVGKGLTAPS